MAMYRVERDGLCCWTFATTDPAEGTGVSSEVGYAVEYDGTELDATEVDSGREPS